MSGVSIKDTIACLSILGAGSVFLVSTGLAGHYFGPWGALAGAGVGIPLGLVAMVLVSLFFTKFSSDA